VLLAALAGVASVLIAAWGIRGLVAIAPAGLPRINEVHVDLHVLLFASAASLGASVIFGLAPSLHASRSDLNEVIKQGARTMSGGGSGRTRAALIVFETAAAVVLVIGAGLLIRSFAELSRVEMGFRIEHLLVADTSVPVANRDAAREGVRFYRNLLPQLAAMPGVQSVAAVMGVPTVVKSNGGYAIEGGLTFEQMGVRSPQAIFTVNTPGYFSTLGMPMVKGRDFTDADNENAPFVTVVNQALARAAFPNGDAIGHRIRSGFDIPDFMEIVGIVADARSSDPALPPQPQIYMPYQQHPLGSTSLTIVMRTASDPLQLSQVVTSKVRAANGDVPVRVSTMEATLDRAVSTPWFRTVLLGIFAAVALVLAMAGVYGVVSFTVSQRTSELGLRMALGAQPMEIIKLTLLGGLRLTVAGVAVGWIASLALARVLSSMLFATSARDPLIFIAVPAVLVAVAALASMAPAIRAARVDPVIALRSE
jgi:predicted permease